MSSNNDYNNSYDDNFYINCNHYDTQESQKDRKFNPIFQIDLFNLIEKGLIYNMLNELNKEKNLPIVLKMPYLIRNG